MENIFNKIEQMAVNSMDDSYLSSFKTVANLMIFSHHVILYSLPLITLIH